MASPKSTFDPKRPMREVLAALEPKPEVSAPREPKHAYASQLSRSLAVLIASALRPQFPSILPTEDDVGHESPTGSSTGKKRLDVKAWSDTLGLELLVSIKTYSFRDWNKKDQRAPRYTKNIQRNGMELKDEADVIHRRQPYSVMVALFFLPLDACDDGDAASTSDVQGLSSFASIVRRLRIRQGRAVDASERMFDRYDLAEKLYIGLYEYEDADRRGWLRFFDVSENPPRTGRPSDAALLTLDGLGLAIKGFLKARNTAGFDWEIAVAEADSDSEDHDGENEGE